MDIFNQNNELQNHIIVWKQYLPKNEELNGMETKANFFLRKLQTKINKIKMKLVNKVDLI